MKVKELISELEGLDPETTVMIATDGEGNDCLEAEEVTLGKITQCEPTDQDDDDGQLCVVIWP